MAMSGEGMKEFVKAKYIAGGRQWTDAMDAAFTLLCEGIVEYIQTAGVVNTVVTGTAATPVGNAVAGTGVGTLT